MYEVSDNLGVFVKGDVIPFVKRKRLSSNYLIKCTNLLETMYLEKGPVPTRILYIITLVLRFLTAYN